MSEFDKLDQFLRENKSRTPQAPHDHEDRMVARWSLTMKRKQLRRWTLLAAAAVIMFGIWGLWPSKDPAVEPVLWSIAESLDFIEEDWDDEIYEEWLSLGRLVSSSQ